MKNLSIKKKLVMVVFSLVLGFLVVLLLLNTLLLEEFYIYTLEDDFIEEANEIKESYDRNDPDFLLTLREHNNEKGYKYVVTNSEGVILLSSVPEFDETSQLTLPKDQVDIITDSVDERTSKGYKYFVLKHPQNDQDQIVIIKSLTPDQHLVISFQLNDVRKNASIANQFFFITGCIMTVFVLMIAYVLSKRIVQPIMDINEQTKKIANLDFEVSLDYHSNDEIGQLSQSISSIAKALDEKIQALNLANRLLENDMISQRQFLASIAHEFKSPIGIIKGYTESIKLNYYETETEKNDYLDYVLDESDQLNNLVEDIVLLAKLDKRDFKLTMSAVDLSSLVLYSLEKYDRLMTKRALHVESSIKSKVMIKGDMVRIEQIVDNILSNANRYTSDQGLIKVSLETDDTHAVLVVKNTAPTIDKMDMSSLTKPFYRLEQSRSRETGGHGLGLTIANGLIDAHGGKFTLNYFEGYFIIKIVLDLYDAM